MKLFKLIEDIEIIRTNIKKDIEIADMTKNSKNCVENSLFFCHKGTRADGNDFIKEAKLNGAAVVITGRDDIADELDASGDFYVLVENTRKTEALLWMKWFSNPCEGLKVIGITGTNGKTSISYMIREILSLAGYKTALLGTIKYATGNGEREAALTTSDPDELAALFAEMRDNGCEYAVMEVSSHSLALDKVSGLRFQMGIFTNLTQDHLDFHGDMESYKTAKAKLFSMCEIGIINIDDGAAEDIIKLSQSENYLYSINTNADFKAENIVYKGTEGSEYDLIVRGGTPLRIKTAVAGTPYVYNTMAAAAAAKLLNIEDGVIKTALENLRVPGRIEKLDTRTKNGDITDFSVFVDYAHTPDALLNVLNSVNSFKKGKGRVITLFGCGGDRDKGKRPLMGEIAMANSDYCIITSDNSRSEEPEDIINDIEKGLEDLNKPYIKIIDRKEAIEYALDFAGEGDIILLAGKGHENYKKDKSGTTEFSEKKIVLEYLANKI